MVTISNVATTARNNKRIIGASPLNLVSHFVVAMFAFQIGVLFGSSMHQCNNDGIAETTARSPGGVSFTSGAVFPKQSIGQLIAGAALVDRANFIQQYDIGVPWDIPSKSGNDQVMVLYTHPDTLPAALRPGQQQNHSLPIFADANIATQNCLEMQVVLVKPERKGQCVSIVGQWESFHVHHFMRLSPSEKGQADLKNPMQYVSKYQQASGRAPGLPSAEALLNSYGPILKDYLERLPSILDRLSPLAQKVAGSGNTVVVMVCNFGQSELFLNFVCSAKARNLDLSKILLFATDDEMMALAEAWGVTAFAVGDDFGEMPKKAARAYGDKVFAGMMMAKVYCVQLINMLGYDLLFQDVDVVWYKDPLDYFHKDNIPTIGDFDLYFQDDGARSSRYAPYSPNTGFYYVRHNARTEYLFSVFLRMGDVIQQSGSHQSALTTLLAGFASDRGLKVKVLGRDDPKGQLFPGGFHYHNRKEFMRQFASNLLPEKPYIFHMSWTHNKDNKQKFLQQMGDWYVKDECVRVEAVPPMQDCCIKEPEVQCHYRDKPSRKPCKDSPPIDAGKKSFW